MLPSVIANVVRVTGTSEDKAVTVGSEKVPS
jgi:hypothetical protein